LTNTLAIFQTYIKEALKNYLDIFCVAYLDDICIYNRFIEKYKEHVRLVLERLRQYKFYVKFSKCKFSKTEIQFLGYIIEVKEIQMDFEKMIVIIKWPICKIFYDA
jgi:hypothetical protein